MRRTLEDAKSDLLIIVNHLRYAVEEAGKNGTAQVAIISKHEDGSGKIECCFDCALIDDIALLLSAPAMTDEIRTKCAALKFLHNFGVTQ